MVLLQRYSVGFLRHPSPPRRYYWLPTSKSRHDPRRRRPPTRRLPHAVGRVCSSAASTSSRQRTRGQKQYEDLHHARCFTTSKGRCDDDGGDDEQACKANDISTNINHVKVNNIDPPMLRGFDRYVPASLQPYARLSRIDKPIGTWLLLWPCCWSTAMATGVSASSGMLGDVAAAAAVPSAALHSVILMGQFTVGAFIMRGAGCTINDLWDQDVDKQVARTTSRPLASGEVTTSQAVAWLGVQLSAGLAVLLSLPHTYYCFGWGAASLPLVVVYPLMKRFFPYPQLVLGLTFNWGAWMGWAASTGSMDYNVIVPLYASGVAWTMVYDTIYANQDKEDDAKLGLQSTALTFSGIHEEEVDPISAAEKKDRRQRKILHTFAALTYGSWLLSGYNLWSGYGCDPETFSFGPYALGVTTAYGHLLWQIQTAQLTPPAVSSLSVSDNDDGNYHDKSTTDSKSTMPSPSTKDIDPHNLGDRFRSNGTVGAIVFGSIIAGKVILFVGI